jgi:glycosyltransferase involved in cell wall biosynthesis
VRVLQVHTRYRQPGGEDTVVENERMLLRRAGHDVELVEFYNPDEALPAVGALIRSPWNKQAAASVVAAARRHRADVVHVHNTWFALSPAVFPALRTAGFPTVATIHNYRFTCVNAILYRNGGVCTDCVGTSPWRGVLHACYRDSRSQSAAVAVTIASQRRSRTWATDVDVVIALTPFAASILERSSVPRERLMVKPNTVPDPGPRARPPSESDVVLFVGRLSEEKGILDLVEAWKVASPSGLRLVVLGDGRLRGEVADRSVGRPIQVVGGVDAAEVRRWMLSARAIAVPSRNFEGMPMVLVESAAAGVPAVVPGHGPFPDLVGGGGWTFIPGSVDSLAGVLAGLGSRAVDEAGVTARERYLDEFSDEVGLRTLEAAYYTARSGLAA